MLDTLSRTRVSDPMAPCAGPASAAPVSQMENSVLGGVESVATASELVARDRHWNRGTSGCEPALPARSPQGHLPKAALLPGFRPWPPSESPPPRSKRVLLDAWPCPAAIVPCTLAVRMTAGVRARGVLLDPRCQTPGTGHCSWAASRDPCTRPRVPAGRDPCMAQGVHGGLGSFSKDPRRYW